MKIYKLIGVEKYTVAFNKEDAVLVFLVNKIGVTTSDLMEIDITPNRDAIGKVFISLLDLQDYEVEL